MYQCRNCGGNLRFDIALQRLKCPYCSSDFDCYEIEETVAESGLYQEGPAEVSDDTYEVSVFSCPACGGEIVSADQSVSEFCSYCGQTVVLEKKMRREKSWGEISGAVPPATPDDASPDCLRNFVSPPVDERGATQPR